MRITNVLLIVMVMCLFSSSLFADEINEQNSSINVTDERYGSSRIRYYLHCTKCGLKWETEIVKLDEPAVEEEIVRHLESCKGKG